MMTHCVFTALRRSDGSFVLNGNWAINWSGDFESKGTSFTYTRDDEQHTESIHSPGPLMEPLDLMVSPARGNQAPERS